MEGKISRQIGNRNATKRDTFSFLLVPALDKTYLVTDLFLTVYLSISNNKCYCNIYSSEMYFCFVNCHYREMERY